MNNLIRFDDAQVLCCGPSVESENIVMISQRVIAGRIVTADTKGVPIHTKLESIAKFHLHSSTPNVTSDFFAVNFFVPRFRCEFSKNFYLACWCRLKFKLGVYDTFCEQKGLAYFKSNKFLDFFHILKHTFLQGCLVELNASGWLPNKRENFECLFAVKSFLRTQTALLSCGLRLLRKELKVMFFLAFGSQLLFYHFLNKSVQ